MSTETLPGETTIEQVELSVSSIDQVEEFYRDIIGFSVIDRGDDTLELGVGETILLVLRERPDRPPRPPDAAGLFHFAVRVPDRSALGDAARRLNDEGHLSGASDHAVSEALYSHDPAGNGIEIYRDRPTDQWPRDGEFVGMTTDPLSLQSLLNDGSSTPYEGLPAGTDLGHIHLEVTDLDRSFEWYVDALGFRERARYDGGRFIAAGDYHHHIGLNVWNQRRRATSGLGLERFTLSVPAVYSLTSLQDRLTARETPGEIHIDGETLEVTDPDGINLRLRR